MGKYRPVSLTKVKTYSITKRKSKVSLSVLAKPSLKGDTVKGFINKLPHVLAVNDFIATVRAIVSARQNGRPVILGMGAHPIKVGLSPIIIDLMKKNIITGIATNGACIVHDFELSVVLATGMQPNTSENPLPTAVTYDDYGFVASLKAKPGIYAAGCTRTPMGVSESVQDGTAAALKAIQSIVRR